MSTRNTRIVEYLTS